MDNGGTQENFAERESDYQLHEQSDMVVFQPSNPLMAKPNIRQQDRRPQRVFFYERITDSEILTFTEQEAATMEKSSHGPYLRQLGCSDGSAYTKSLKECGLKTGSLVSREKARQILLAAHTAELEAARGHLDRPMAQDRFWGGSSADTSNPEDARRDFIGGKNG